MAEVVEKQNAIRQAREFGLGSFDGFGSNRAARETRRALDRLSRSGGLPGLYGAVENFSHRELAEAVERFETARKARESAAFDLLSGPRSLRGTWQSLSGTGMTGDIRRAIGAFTQDDLARAVEMLDAFPEQGNVAQSAPTAEAEPSTLSPSTQSEETALSGSTLYNWLAGLSITDRLNLLVGALGVIQELAREFEAAGWAELPEASMRALSLAMVVVALVSAAISADRKR